MKVAEAVGRTLAQLGVKHVFAVVGSGNFHVTNALIAGGAGFTSARHENGAVTMSDAYTRLSGNMAAASLHQGCGLTNGMTGIAEAAKSRTPILVIAGDTPPTDKTSNFWIDQASAVTALGAEVARIHSARTAVADATKAFQVARDLNRTVVLNMPIDVQEEEIDWCPKQVQTTIPLPPTNPSKEAVLRIAEVLRNAQRPVIVGGRGALGAKAEIAQLAETCGALLATSAVSRGLFADEFWSVDVMGGFASPVAAALIQDADVIVAFGASLNRWTTRGSSLTENATIVQIDTDPASIGRHHPVDLPVIGDARGTAMAINEHFANQVPASMGYRTEDTASNLKSGRRWRDVPFSDTSTERTIDPRTLTIALDDMLPTSRIVVPDGGNFLGYPTMFLEVPDEKGICLTLAMQSIGLGLSAAIGSAIASPERLVVAAIGDGGFMMSHVELDTAIRLKLPLLIIIYNDNAYGAEVHVFEKEGWPLTTVEFPETDIAAIARGYGCESVTVRNTADLVPVVEWIASGSSRPMVIDAKVSSFPSWLLADAHANDNPVEHPRMGRAATITRPTHSAAALDDRPDPGER